MSPRNTLTAGKVGNPYTQLIYAVFTSKLMHQSTTQPDNMLEPTSYFIRVSLIASQGTNFEKEDLFSFSAESSITSQPCSKRPQSRVDHSFLLHEIMKITSIRRGQVTREKGKLQGSKSSMPIQMIVETMKVMLPLSVYIPPNLELLFQSCTRKYDRVTPGMMTSTMGSHEHFLKRLLTKSGTSKKMGEESSPAQSLQDWGRRKWSTTEMMVMVATMMVMARQLCLRELKWKILMLPTQMQMAIMSQRIQLSERKAKIVTPRVSTPLPTSQYLTDLYALRFSLPTRNSIQLKQRNTKNIDITIPKYRIITVAFEKSLKVRKQRLKSTPIPMPLKMRKGFQNNTYLRGRWLIRMDHTWECMATPIIMAEFISAISKYPISNFLCLVSGSQFTKKLKKQDPTSTLTLLKQFQSEQSLPVSFPQLQLNQITKWVQFALSAQGSGSGLGDEVTKISVLRRVGILLYETTNLLQFCKSMMLRLPFRQLSTQLKVPSLQSSFSSPLVQMRASALSLSMQLLATSRLGSRD